MLLLENRLLLSAGSWDDRVVAVIVVVFVVVVSSTASFLLSPGCCSSCCHTSVPPANVAAIAAPSISKCCCCWSRRCRRQRSCFDSLHIMPASAFLSALCCSVAGLRLCVEGEEIIVGQNTEERIVEASWLGRALLSLLDKICTYYR